MVLECPLVVIRVAAWAGDSDALAAIRRRVFIEEQQVPEELEWDGEDACAQHWLALREGQPVGTVRLLVDGHIGRMAVLARERKQGLGSKLLRAAIDAAREQAMGEVYLHAQLQALGFYARHGFVAEGEMFMDAGITHRVMRLVLSTGPNPSPIPLA
jgi:predicted GNAT family N-acyltransferase